MARRPRPAPAQRQLRSLGAAVDYLELIRLAVAETPSGLDANARRVWLEGVAYSRLTLHGKFQAVLDAVQTIGLTVDD